MKVLITGGAGFIGSNLAKRLSSKNHEVVVVDNLSFGHVENLEDLPIRFINLDICHRLMREVVKETDIVFHFAGYSSLPYCEQHKLDALRVNVQGTVNILEAVANSKIKVVFASTNAIYENATTFPTPETDISKPDLCYATTKLMAEMMCNNYANLTDMDVCSLRFHNIFGHHQDVSRASPPLIPYMLEELKNDRCPTFYGDGRQCRDYVYIDDALDLCELLMTTQKTRGVFNCCTGYSASVNEMYEWAQKLMNKPALSPIRKPIEEYWEKFNLDLPKKRITKEVIKFSKGDPSKTKRELGWIAKHSWAEGLRKMIELPDV